MKIVYNVFKYIFKINLSQDLSSLIIESRKNFQYLSFSLKNVVNEKSNQLL